MEEKMLPLQGYSVFISNPINLKDPLQFTAGKSIGPFQIGMSKQEVANVLGKALDPNSKNIDYFEELGLKVEYDTNDQVISVEFDDHVDIQIESFSIFNQSFSALCEFLKKLDPQATIEDDTLTSNQLGLSIWTERDESQPPILVTLFKPK